MSKSSRLMETTEAKGFLPPLSESDNKARRGRSLILAGSSLFPGAGILTARAALRSGSGYVILAQDQPPFLALSQPDFLVADLSRQGLETLQFSAAAIGPGFGVSDRTEFFIERFQQMKTASLVLDADALTVLARMDSPSLLPSWILTPHEGELARLMNVPSEIIHEDREQWAMKAQEKFGCIVLLKGHGTLIATPAELVRIPTGNSSLAKAGTGDVLTGIITGLLAQGLSPVSAACLGAYAHGLCAELWVADQRDPLGLMASDLLELIPRAFHRLRSL